MKKKIVILLLLLSCLIYVGCGTKIVEEHDNVKVEDLSEDEINYLMKFIDQLKYFDFFNKDFKVNELSNQEVLQFTYDYYSKRGTVKNISFKDLQEYADTYLDFALEPENVLCVTHFNLIGGSDYLYLYNIDSGKFSHNKEHIDHEEEGFYSTIYNKYVSSKKEGDRYEVVVNKAFSELVSENMDIDLYYYRSYEDAINKKSSIFKTKFDYTKSEYNPNAKDLLDNYKGELNSYTYVFKKIDDKFVFISYSK